MNARSSVDAIVSVLLPKLQAYSWPGNVRELQSLLERALLLDPFPEVASPDGTPPLHDLLPELFGNPHFVERCTDLRRVGKAMEVKHVRRIVDECNGDLNQAAERLGVSRSTVWRRLRTRQ